MTAPVKVRRYDVERQRRYRAERRAAREASTAQQIEREVRTANSSRLREVRVVRLPGGRVFALGAFAGTECVHPFVPDGATGTSCRLCFGWSSDYRHTSTV